MTKKNTLTVYIYPNVLALIFDTFLMCAISDISPPLSVISDISLYLYAHLEYVELRYTSSTTNGFLSPQVIFICIFQYKYHSSLHFGMRSHLVIWTISICYFSEATSMSLALKTSLREEYRIRSVYNVHKMTLRCQLLSLYTGQLQCYKNNNSVLMNDGSVLVLLNLTCTLIYLPECFACLKPKIRLINDLHSFFGWTVCEHVVEYVRKVRGFILLPFLLG